MKICKLAKKIFGSTQRKGLTKGI
jgi:ATP-dependent DNA ligase